MIPKRIHLLKTDADAAHINPINYWSIKSILDHHSDFEVVLHTPQQPLGDVWAELLPRLSLNIETSPQLLAGKHLTIAQHQADVWRTQKLIEYGGFYFDWDLVCLRSIDSLRDQFCVLGMEKSPSGAKEVLGVSAIGAQKNSVFLTCWLSMMEGRFNQNNYLGHSVILAREIALAMPVLLNVLPSESFYHPGWSQPDMDWMFDPVYKLSADELANYYRAGWGVHFFESNASFLKYQDEVSFKLPVEPKNNFEELLLLAQP